MFFFYISQDRRFTGFDALFLTFAFVGEVVRASHIGFPLNILSFVAIIFQSLYDLSWFPVRWCPVSYSCVRT